MSIDDPFKLSSGVYLMLVSKGKALLLRRSNTRWAAGFYSFISGFIDGNETIFEAVIREAKEEMDIKIALNDLKLIHIMHRKSGDVEFVDFYFRAENWKGTPRIVEPEKCNDIKWFPINDFPRNVVSHLKQVIKFYKKGIYFSEYGF